jgi:hypothetical protein
VDHRPSASISVSGAGAPRIVEVTGATVTVDKYARYQQICKILHLLLASEDVRFW